MVFQEQQVLSKYQLQKRLGRTATGHQTWLANDLTSERSVVIKLLAFNPQMRWEELKLFEREAQTLKALNHPRIPQYYDYFDLDKEVGGGVPWFALVQQYIPGLSLQESLEQNQRFSEEKIRSIAEETLDILIYLHQLNPSVLHRDIKPSNLILGEDDRIYLIDFGAVQGQAAMTGVTFTVVGTVGYAPLEQFWGRAIEASDLYALGATLIHLLTGRSPADLPQKDSRIQFRDRVNLQSNLVDWLEKITELTIEKRFKQALEAKEALNSGSFIYHPRNNSQFSRQPVRKKLKSLRIPTLIKLTKYQGQLEIQIPPGGLDRVDEIFNNGCGGLLSYLVMFFFAFSFSVIIPGLSSVFFLLIVTKVFLLVGSKTEVYLDKNAAKISSKIFGLKHSGEICPNEQIEDVFVQRTGSIFQVALRGRDRIYNLGGALKQNEAAWLAQEIRDYLNI
ncbi:serine/threonine protein kinase [Pleurocapsales cyanobacterium LEGE 10410]|nr:serine/threonine protein kinase [Pleurocapsales cyanobacterium LEGE 10410]